MHSQYIKIRRLNGFTIIETIVVIAVIGILATIVGVGYNSWKRSTIETQLKSDLTAAANAMEDYRNFNDGYPESIPSTFTASEGVVLTGGSSNGQAYCIDATSISDPSLKFSITESAGANVIRDKLCGIQGIVTTLAGSSTSGYADGIGEGAMFSSSLGGATVDPYGAIYVADTSNNRIRKITTSGVVTTFAGSTSGYADDTGVAAKFYWPSDVASDRYGNLYVADTQNNRIRKISTSGVVTTLAGSTYGYTDGTGAVAKFANPSGVAVDSSGNVYVSDNYNNRIRKVTPAGVVTTLAGSTSGYADGIGSVAQFDSPKGLTVDSSGNVYVADSGNVRIRKVTPAGVVTTLAGSTSGYADGLGTVAKFGNPLGIGIDSSGNLYVTDSGNNRFCKITPAGEVTTLAGYTAGYADGTGTAARFNRPYGVAVDASGIVYVADTDNFRIRKIE